MSDGKYFSTTKRGEIKELSEELRSLDKTKKKEAVKKVIAAMTVGKDVAMLFPDVVNCMQTEDLELKKLVYLYLINYSKSQPDLAIMAVNTFVKDSQDPNPLIRALAVRTMGCIRVDKITEYLCDPLYRCLKDDDPYVRKTAAICVAKLHDINAEMVEDRGFLEQLKGMLQDSNPMVVANAVAALAEIQELSGKQVFEVTNTIVFKLLAALNECNEWGQVFILDAMASYVPSDPAQAESIIQRVVPRLQHANGAVVMSSVKVIVKQMSMVSDTTVIRTWCRKMAPPLVTLLSAEPEVQYVALRNINLIVQKFPEVLTNDVKVFFCKYNDPLYVKMEKLEVMIKLATDENVDQVLLEFKEYAQEIDVDFVRKAVRAIGRAAVNLEKAAKRCINVLLELIQTKVNYVVQEAIVVIKDIFRKYPNTYESIIGTLCESLDSLDEPEAKASMIWIIGEYADRIDNADELLESFLETFPDEPSMVQLQLLTAAVKLFLKKATDLAQKMISMVLSAATTEVDNPDLRDRAFVYWRLLSTDPEAAKEIVLSQKPVISDDTNSLEPLLLEDLLSQMSTLASVYHKPPGTFVNRAHMAVQKAEDLKARSFQRDSTIEPSSSAIETEARPAPEVDLLGDLLGFDAPVVAVAPSQPQTTVTTPPPAAGGDVMDLLGDLDLSTPTPAPAPVDRGIAPPLSELLPDLYEPVETHPAPVAAQPLSDPFGFGGGGDGHAFGTDPTPAITSLTPPPPNLPTVLSAELFHGMEVRAKVVSDGAAPVYKVAISNGSQSTLSGFMLQFNVNSFGLQPTDQVLHIAPIQPGSHGQGHASLTVNPARVSQGPLSDVLEVALKTAEFNVAYFSDKIPLEALLQASGTIDTNSFLEKWKGLSGVNEFSQSLPITIPVVETMIQQLNAVHIFLMAHRKVPTSHQEAVYVTCRAVNIPQILVELRFTCGVQGVACMIKTERPEVMPFMFSALQRLLSS